MAVLARFNAIRGMVQSALVTGTGPERLESWTPTAAYRHLGSPWRNEAMNRQPA